MRIVVIDDMALFCPECGAQIVSKRVGFCPTCRSPLPESMRLGDQARVMIDTEFERAKRAARERSDDTGEGAGFGFGWAGGGCDGGGDGGGD